MLTITFWGFNDARTTDAALDALFHEFGHYLDFEFDRGKDLRRSAPVGPRLIINLAKRELHLAVIIFKR